MTQEGVPGGSRVFSIHLKDPEGDRIQRIRRDFPYHFQLSPSSILIRTNHDAIQVAEKIGFIRDGQIALAIFKVSDVFAGFYDADLWEWLEIARPETETKHPAPESIKHRAPLDGLIKGVVQGILIGIGILLLLFCSVLRMT